MASSRSRRDNAGSKMAALLEGCEKDDFYQSTYGGFFDEEDDMGFDSPVDSDSDSADSDFDQDENELADGGSGGSAGEEDVVGAGRKRTGDVDDDDDDDGKRKHKRGRVFTKAYVEPDFKGAAAKKRKLQSTVSTDGKSSVPATGDNEKPVGLPKKQHSAVTKSSTKNKLIPVEIDPDLIKEESFRASTLSRRAEANSSRHQADEKSRRRRVASRPSAAKKRYRPKTQAERLAEVEKTEKLNIKSLERFEQAELERKARSKVSKKRAIVGPAITHYSCLMPVVVVANRTGLGQSNDERVAQNTDLHEENEQTKDPQPVATSSALTGILTTLPALDSIETGNSGLTVNSTGDNGEKVSSRLASAPDSGRTSRVGLREQLDQEKREDVSKTGELYSRTFVTFSDDVTFERVCPNLDAFAHGGAKKPRIPLPTYCAVTGLPARYKDPITGVPYATAEAFTVIRKAYDQFLEEKQAKAPNADITRYFESKKA